MTNLKKDTELATAMLSCLQRFGAQDSNPVLAILDGQVPVNDQKYPAQNLAFAGGRWRAFYHCHATPDNAADEHGHFHLFVNLARQAEAPRWAHAAGLSMSRLGQPLAWFTVNHWVTEGDWLAGDQLPALLHHCVQADNAAGVASWLALMLGLYHDDLITLYQLRDRFIAQTCHNTDLTKVFKDRGVYTLAALDINLEERLVNLLSTAQGAQTSHHPGAKLSVGGSQS